MIVEHPTSQGLDMDGSGRGGFGCHRQTSPDLGNSRSVSHKNQGLRIDRADYGSVGVPPRRALQACELLCNLVSIKQRDREPSAVVRTPRVAGEVGHLAGQGSPYPGTSISRASGAEQDLECPEMQP